MGAAGASKRARKLLVQLSEFQYRDQELTGPICISIKHELLRNSHHCKAVEIFPAADTALNIPMARDSVRKFILSQLEVQKLTDQETSVVFLSPLVRFIVSCLPPVGQALQDVSPTTFIWYCYKTHKTFCIFAFVDRKHRMPSPKYSVQQLLELRDRGTPMLLADAPQKGVNHALQTISNGRQIGSESRESRTLGRFHKYRPFHTQQSSTVRSRIDFPVAHDEVVYVRDQPRREPTTDLPAEMEWRYRGRTGSEAVASAEPLSAPTGINAQQSEGFQRFYKAVISPSHVRVTAGGRIVPNTRGTSPMSKRPKDKVDENGHTKDDSQQPELQAQRPPEGSYLTGPSPSNMPFFAFPPHPFYPPFPNPMPRMSGVSGVPGLPGLPGLPGMPGMPMMQLPIGLGMPGGLSFPPQSGPPSNIPQFMPSDAMKNPAKENLQNGNRSESSGLKAPAFDQANDQPRLMPSEQLDRLKPFMFNGQVLYPFAPPNAPPHMASGPPSQAPPALPGYPNFPLSAFHSPLMGQPPVGMNHMLNPSLGLPAQPGPFQALQPSTNESRPSASANTAPAQSLANGLQPPSAPPISSIRPSEISRKQIEVLRGSLKYHEDQLLYNRHQIDEKEMEHTVQMLRSQIDRFEALNQSQLRFEESHYPKKEAKPVEANGPRHRAVDRASHSSASMQGTVKHASSSTRRSDSIRRKHMPRKKEPLFHLNPVDPSFSLSDPIKKSTLPVKAALAPPFEPRTLVNIDAQAPRVGGSFQWDGAAVDESSVSGQGNGGHVFRGPSQDRNLSFSTTFNNPEPKKPYLVGTLPAGIDPKNARETDYVYERDLTPDETRSRYLYWGRAPSFTRRGLPKFDGKDFYPASPVNNTKRDSPPPPLLGRHVPIGDSNVDYYTGAFHPKDAQASRSSNTGRYASEFQRERRKPVKVTLRRPDSNPPGESKQSSDKGAKVSEEAAKKTSQGGKQDVQADNARTKFLHTVLKRNISTNSEVLPSALTTATAQGVLPQYSTGYDSLVAASLSPVRSSPVAQGRLSPVKSDDGSSIFITPASRKVGENRPSPDSVGPISLEQQFQGMAFAEDNHHTVLPAHWESV